AALRRWPARRGDRSRRPPRRARPPAPRALRTRSIRRAGHTRPRADRPAAPTAGAPRLRPPAARRPAAARSRAPSPPLPPTRVPGHGQRLPRLLRRECPRRGKPRDAVAEAEGHTLHEGETFDGLFRPSCAGYQGDNMVGFRRVVAHDAFDDRVTGVIEHARLV